MLQRMDKAVPVSSNVTKQILVAAAYKFYRHSTHPVCNILLTMGSVYITRIIHVRYVRQRVSPPKLTFGEWIIWN